MNTASPLTLESSDLKAAIELVDLKKIETFIKANPKLLRNFNHSNFSLLDQAVGANSLDFLNLLVKYGVNVNLQDRQGMTSLHLAIRKGAVEMAKALIELGTDVNLKNLYNETPMDSALSYLQLDIIDELLRGGVDINGRNPRGVSYLARATSINNASLVRHLIAWHPSDQSIKEALESAYDVCLNDEDEVVKVLKAYRLVKKEQSLLHQVVSTSIQERGSGESQSNPLSSKPTPRL